MGRDFGVSQPCLSLDVLISLMHLALVCRYIIVRLFLLELVTVGLEDVDDEELNGEDDYGADSPADVQQGVHRCHTAIVPVRF